MSWRTITDRAKRSDVILRLADFLGRGRGRMRWLDHLHRPAASPLKPDLARWGETSLSAAWIGHATVLLRVGGLNVLTDPVMHNRVGIGLGLITGGPQRLVAPALALDDLPPIDLILLSHAHYDHLCRPTLCRLNKNIPVVTSRRTRDLVRDLGFRRVHELHWGESLTHRGVKLTAREVSHWGARTFIDRHRGFNAYLIETTDPSAPRRRVLYGGDTAYHERFKDIGKVDLAVLGIGGYDPYVQAHATPEQAWTMAGHVQADYLLPMHHSTFRLSHERTAEPMERLLTAAGADAARVAVRQVGGQWASRN